MKKIITIFFAIAIFQIPAVFAQTFVENRYFNENSGEKTTGVYEDKLVYVHENGNLYLVDGSNIPIFLTTTTTIEDNFIFNGTAQIANEFEIDNQNNFNIINTLDFSTDIKDIAKDNNENYYFVDSDGKLFAYDEGGNHTELYILDYPTQFTGLTVDDNYIIISRFTNEGSRIIKIPKTGGENIIFNYTALGVEEIICVEFSNNNQEIIIYKGGTGTNQVCKVENDGNLTELFEITELVGAIEMSASIDENDNYHVLVTGQNGSLEIVYEEETNNVQNLQNIQILVSPNPTNGIINVKTQEQIEKITILNITGKIILETTNTEINLSKQKTGTYFIKIETENGILTEKIVVE